MNYQRVGIIGAGVIGQAIFDAIVAQNLAAVDYVLVDERFVPPADATRLREHLTTDVRRALAASTELVIEAAHPDVVARLGAELLAKGDLCAFSSSALADESIETAVRRAAAAAGTRLLIPHGAVVALDGLSDGRDAIDQVIVTTTKNGASLGSYAGAQGVLFEGSTREACTRFPRNVNVHAALAIAGIGFDRTRSIVVANPETRQMRHRVQVFGQGFEWDISVSSTTLGGVSGAYTPKSAVGSIHRIFGFHPVAAC
ncbi:DNA-binding protein [Bosea sp. WAO]|uniref:aspartate dehydrogenase domain-containing protein n=1 Tax=Bosea sp. WAO TaxID=406341 RepID=UPI0007476217|nr:aspartate dehydrogenase domain-containing protein [Bosea sp. WAO]KUL94544.1 DNA-binding protein [Bosea sp. WAO]